MRIPPGSQLPPPVDIRISFGYADYMIRDSRGGHNRYKINEDFFKIWSGEMAYILGYIYADGCLIDSRRASRTQYITITSKDSSILYKIRKVLESESPLRKEIRKSEWKSRGQLYISKPSYTLRIGNKVMFNDLTKLGLTPRKSLNLTFPEIPEKQLNHFLRGYFDGDGCLYLSRKRGENARRVKLFFTSGGKIFLKQLSKILFNLLKVPERNIYDLNGCFGIYYPKSTALKILDFLYKDTQKSQLYLERKHQRYLMLLKEKSFILK